MPWTDRMFHKYTIDQHVPEAKPSTACNECKKRTAMGVVRGKKLLLEVIRRAVRSDCCYP